MPVRELWVIGQRVRAATTTHGHRLVSGDYFDRRLAFLREWERRVIRCRLVASLPGLLARVGTAAPRVVDAGVGCTPGPYI